MKTISVDSFFEDEELKKQESTKFLRHLTYNHNEIVKSVMTDLPKQKPNQEFNWFQ